MRTRIAAAILLLFVATLISLDQFGKSRRRHARRQEVLEVERPEQTLDAWRERGVRGRTLILFSAFPHLWRSSFIEGTEAGGAEGFVERAALDNVVRRVYFLLPDDTWSVMFRQDLPGFFRDVPGLARGKYMHYPLGLPVIATTPTSLPHLSEPALVYVDRTRFEPAFAEELLAKKGIAFDLLVVSSGM